ncbi:putative serine/arginine repetitive matrix protein 1-like [Cocos nucifera]|uniref:Putative serine/arginine repetitive matrix protein 1-like n=1 Tax=Cocos nucifera TaxID=13894 RepID=A0A8K0HUW4_COCNU|nr:putative serine/arginine repetitive matrix protein 1-like [Cocos nucifera]
MCAADDVFLQGKLLPFGEAPPRPPKKDDIYNPRSLPRDQWRPETTTEYQRLRKAPESDVRVPPPPQPPRSRSRWYLFVLGSVRVPATMEMKDIRRRQRRRSPAAIPEDSGRWSFERSKSWKLLRSLSCTGMSAVAAAPLSFVSHV